MTRIKHVLKVVKKQLNRNLLGRLFDSYLHQAKLYRRIAPDRNPEPISESQIHLAENQIHQSWRYF